MPQPLTSMGDGTAYNVEASPVVPFDKHPDLAILALKCIATWTAVETEMASAITTLLGAKADVGMAMLGAIVSAPARRDAVQAVLNVALPEDHPDKSLFDAALKAFNALQGRRNKFVHHLWGTSPQAPEALVLAPPEFFTDWRAKHFISMYGGGGARRLDDDAFSPARFAAVMVYTKSDLENLLQELEDACLAWRHLDALAHPSDFIMSKDNRDDCRAALREIPFVKRALSEASR